MSVTVASNRFIVSSIAGFYQHFVSRISNFQELGDSLVREAEIAQAFRQTDKLKDLGVILTNFPLQEYSIIGQYYLAWCEYRNGQNVQDKFERIIESSKSYKPKVLFSLAALVTSNNDVETGIKYYSEAIKLANSPSVFVGAVKGIAVVKSIEGFKQSALKDLERISPIVKYVNPKTYYDYLNSLAVELGEVGRTYEAQNISNLVLASPFINAYPEWRQTAEDLRGANRSFVAINPTPYQHHNVLTLPVIQQGSIEDSQQASQQQGPAKVLNLQQWKKKMGKEPNGNQKNDKTPQDLDDMTNKDLIVEILQRTSNQGMSEKKLRKILEYVLEVESEPED